MDLDLLSKVKYSPLPLTLGGEAWIYQCMRKKLEGKIHFSVKFHTEIILGNGRRTVDGYVIIDESVVTIGIVVELVLV